jgi:hypothetical protein
MCSAGLWSRKPSSPRPAPSKDARRIRCMAIFFCLAIPPCRSSMKSIGFGTEEFYDAALQRDPTRTRDFLALGVVPDRGGWARALCFNAQGPTAGEPPDRNGSAAALVRPCRTPCAAGSPKTAPSRSAPSICPVMSGTKRAPRTAGLVGATGSLPGDLAIHRAVLAYLSDMTLLGAALGAHTVFETDLQVASLDHPVWFHRPFCPTIGF